jgi:hypothetical protein
MVGITDLTMDLTTVGVMATAITITVLQVGVADTTTIQ